MKSTLVSMVISVLIILGVVSSESYGISGAGNISMISAWAIIILGCLALFMPPSEIYKEKTVCPIVVKGTGLSVILVMAYFGWMVTAVSYLAVWLLLIGKKASYLAEAGDNNG